MPDYPIKFNRPPSEPYPISPGGISFSPTIHFDWSEDYGLPDSGEMVVKFKKTRDTTLNTPRGKSYEVTLEIVEIVRVKAAKEEEREESSEEALDALAEDSDKEGE